MMQIFFRFFLSLGSWIDAVFFLLQIKDTESDRLELEHNLHMSFDTNLCDCLV